MMMKKRRVLVVGSAEQSNGGVTSVIKLIKRMPVWASYECYWLGTQIQAGRWTKAYYSLRAYLLGLILVWRYHIVHFHTTPNKGMFVQLPIFLLALLGRKKIVVHLHVGTQLGRALSYKFRLAHWCMRKADRLVLLAPSFAQLLDKYWPDVKTPRTVIYNACEDVEPLPYEMHEKTILFCAPFIPNKAADVLIRAFAKVKDKYPDWKVQFLAAGSEEAACRRLIGDLGMESQVELPGFVFGAEKANYFRKASIYCMCSYQEGQPMVVMEAWAYGVPVVSTPVGALVDLAEEDRNLCTFPFGDSDSLAARLDRMMGDAALRQRMSVYSQDYARKNFSPTRISDALDHLYQSLT